MEGSPLNRIARSALIALIALACAIAAPHARAQGLSDDLVQSGTPDQGAIDSYVNSKFDTTGAITLIDALAKQESAAKARKRLGEPLQRSSARPNPAFRSAYSRAVKAKLEALTKDASDDVAVNALRLCGLVGTKDALDLAVAALEDAREPVRVAAAAAIATGLASAQRLDPNQRAAFSERQATDILDAVNVRFAKEKAPRIVEALVIALDSAIRVPEKVTGVRSRAMDILLRQSSRLAGELNGAEFDPLFGNIAKALSDAFSLAEKFPDGQKTAANKVAGDIVARTVRRLDAGELTDAQRTELALVVEQAEYIIKINGGGSKLYGLAALVRTGKDAEFKAKAADLIKDVK